MLLKIADTTSYKKFTIWLKKLIALQISPKFCVTLTSFKSNPKLTTIFHLIFRFFLKIIGPLKFRFTQ